MKLVVGLMLSFAVIAQAGCARSPGWETFDARLSDLQPALHAAVEHPAGANAATERGLNVDLIWDVNYYPRCPVLHATATANGIPMKADSGGIVLVGHNAYDCSAPHFFLDTPPSLTGTVEIRIVDESATLVIQTLHVVNDAKLSPTLPDRVHVGDELEVAISPWPDAESSVTVDLLGLAGKEYVSLKVRATATGLAVTVPSVPFQSCDPLYLSDGTIAEPRDAGAAGSCVERAYLRAVASRPASVLACEGFAQCIVASKLDTVTVDWPILIEK